VPAGAFTEAVQIRQVTIATFIGSQSPEAALASAQALFPNVTEVVARPGGVYLATAEREALVLEMFSLDALVDGSTVQPGEPVQLEFEVTPEMLAAAGGNPNRIRLAFRDEDAARFQDVRCAVDRAVTPNTVVCSLPHFSLWVLYVAPEEAPVAAQAVPVPADTGMGASASSGVTDPMAIALGLLALVGIGGLSARFAVRRARA